MRKTAEQIDQEMDLAIAEIKAVLNKYGMTLATLYDAAEAITICHTQPSPGGSAIELVERKTDL